MHTLGALLLVFAYEVGAAVILPTPTEMPAVAYSWLPIGWLFVFAVAGKIVGSYLIFFVGDRVKRTERFEAFCQKHKAIGRLMAYSERLLDRFGVVALFVLLSIPGFPDTLPLYVFALAGRRPVMFALASGFGTAVRISLVIAGFEGVLLPFVRSL